MAKVLSLTLAAVAAVLAFGTAGYMVILPGTALFDAFYMTVITVTTVGFSEILPLDGAGRLFTALLVLLGWSVLTMMLALITSNIVSGRISTLLGRKKVERQIEQLRNHFIVCGFGRMGEIVSNELARCRMPFVVVESDPAVCEQLLRREILHVMGDAGDEDVLRQARLEHARGIVATVGSDANNVFVCLTARQMNPGLFILARALDTGSERKLRAAGANTVVSPYNIGGVRLANAILRPHVVDLIDLATLGDGMEVRMEQIAVPAGSRMVGKQLKDAGIHQDYGLIIIGIRRRNGEFRFNPGGAALLEADDTLITMGPPADLKRLEADLAGPRA